METPRYEHSFRSLQGPGVPRPRSPKRLYCSALRSHSRAMQTLDLSLVVSFHPVMRRYHYAHPSPETFSVKLAI